MESPESVGHTWQTNDPISISEVMSWVCKTCGVSTKGFYPPDPNWKFRAPINGEWTLLSCHETILWKIQNQ